MAGLTPASHVRTRPLGSALRDSDSEMGATVPLRRRGGHELAGRAVEIQQILWSTHRRVIPCWACGEGSDASVRGIMLGGWGGGGTRHVHSMGGDYTWQDVITLDVKKFGGASLNGIKDEYSGQDAQSEVY